MEFARGGWVNEDDPNFGANSEILARPQGRFHMAGDQLTFVSGWQEGAVIAAHHAVTEYRPAGAGHALRPVHLQMGAMRESAGNRLAGLFTRQ